MSVNGYFYSNKFHMPPNGKEPTSLPECSLPDKTNPKC